MSTYPGLKGGHFLQGVEEGGAIVSLDDGARFKVYEGFVCFTRDWQQGHMLRVKENPKNGAFPYKLINIHANNSAEAEWLVD
ncbi:hypothetical protein [Sulfuriflexus mobilis]|uniref:hypothetical protein n=1 Tax=Sulfuriflexus mobilis TaxID=1811807 RepID=UPI000F848402|nr:hypothetical protein [Sulfuriflexus mobilis]